MFQLTTPSTGSVEKRQKRDNLLIQIVLFPLFLLLNSTYGIYGPGYLFKGTTPLHHAFLIFIIFAFTGAYCALIIGDKPQSAKLQRFYSIISVVSVSLALSFLVTDLFLQYATFSILGSKFWKNEKLQFIKSRSINDNNLIESCFH
ncbi:hypothetical protein Patl1_26587 [Pistacia atlantica]|uniref:Uncharacterized protein n=1 Tax=Pistacia atlantica TaxID=434234 RepID=A0ACC1AYW0_9ROSI|nr:hypothetical protein Patl1_26587 [Pistacia atlantica]